MGKSITYMQNQYNYYSCNTSSLENNNPSKFCLPIRIFKFNKEIDIPNNLSNQKDLKLEEKEDNAQINNKDFNKITLNEIQCSIGKEVLYDACYCNEKHKFCYKCIEDWLKTHDYCPIDGKFLQNSSLKFDSELNAKINNLDCVCHNQENGCKYSGIILEYKIHILSQVCRFEKIYCNAIDKEKGNNCTFYAFSHSEVLDHKRICLDTIIECEHCNKLFNRYELIAEENDKNIYKNKKHYYNCIEAPITCENNCGLIIKTKYYPEHLMNDCNSSIVKCPNDFCESYGLKENIYGDHINKSCLYRAINCSNCQKVMKQIELLEHLKSYCDKVLVTCSVNGCGEKLLKENLDKHIFDKHN